MRGVLFVWCLCCNLFGHCCMFWCLITFTDGCWVYGWLGLVVFAMVVGFVFYCILLGFCSDDGWFWFLDFGFA